MRNPHQPDPVLIRIPRRDRQIYLITAICFGLIGLAALCVALVEAGFVLGFIIAGVSLPVAMYLLDGQAGRTTLTAEGIRAWRPMLRHSCRWADVTDITQQLGTGKGGDPLYVVIHRKNGRKFKLPAPQDLNEAGPRFTEQFDMIRSYWRNAVPDTRHASG
jgi:hypothetical protein